MGWFYINEYCAAMSEHSIHKDIINLIFTKDDHTIEPNDEDDVSYPCQSFKSSAKICKERLEIFGATKQKVEQEFNYLLNGLTEVEDEFENHIHINYDTYLVTIKNIISNNILGNEGNFASNNFIEHLIGNNCTISKGIFENYYLTLHSWLYSMLISVTDDAIIRYDIFNSTNDLKEIVENQKIILLTEGRTDSRFIKAGFELFNPYLLPFYSLIDYDELRYAGGASMIVHSIKSFAGSGIQNKIIGLFDNDMTGSKEIDSLQGLLKESFPNIKAYQYPPICICENYPTECDYGFINMDINGLAGSIEMYLGKDTLTDEAGILYPIVWSKNKEQGALSDSSKKIVQKKFTKEIKKVKDASLINEQKWGELKAILNLIKHAWD